ncbi:DUF4136 domain-containing protein [Shewanella schlegeliana]|uniref:DUF4136 domain-containing protein n=1 Tax=Shewanella schlegeliana TaxID=190308 RepID=A0ABS1T0A7_9GAMM|nr:DUF4136 domain-containing protein [Shewanella schlegeliana]MBL4914216.1 DUF4136 domain-containing protein [Shewanella schlegeliana]MCL1111390.1 DUF4136 domain-containing protein [Shewanella schlegeliana]GIU33925.1 hypothetical protein TUM4433_29250 [Shewanella schlegeliana]
MKKLLVVMAALALSACSSLKTSSDYDPGVNFSDVKTYAWVEKKTADSAYHLDGLMDQRVRKAVNDQLQLKGLKETDAANADVLVNYLTKVDKKINVDTFNTNYGYNPYYGPGWGWGGTGHTQTTVREYDVGTLILDMVNAKTGKLIWRGSVADTMRDKDTPEERVEVVNEAVAALLLNYPPKPEGK